MDFSCPICLVDMVYVPPEQRHLWSLEEDDTPVKNQNGAPYTELHVPVVSHESHTFHRHCIKKFVEDGGEDLPGVVYRKVLSAILPCFTYTPKKIKGCPVCRNNIICSTQLTENSALTPEYKKKGNNDMPVPAGFNKKAGYKIPKRRTILEISFVITILLFTTVLVFISNNCFNRGPLRKAGEPDSYLFRAAKFYKLNQIDFKGFEEVGNYFLRPKVSRRA